MLVCRRANVLDDRLPASRVPPRGRAGLARGGHRARPGIQRAPGRIGVHDQPRAFIDDRAPDRAGFGWIVKHDTFDHPGPVGEGLALITELDELVLD